MKKLRILIIVLCVFVLAGCTQSYNKSPEAVAKEMATRLSSENYKNIDELLGESGSVFVDEKTFDEYLSDSYIDIAGNKKVKVKKSKTIGNNAKVVLELDEGFLTVNCIKKNDKWYVDLSDEYDKNLVITVPANSTVKLNDKVLDFKKYGKTVEKEFRGYSKNTKVNVDSYTIPLIFEGDYELTVENPNTKTITEEIDSDRDYYYEDSEYISSIKYDEYFLMIPLNEEIEKSVKQYVTDFYTELFDSLNNNKEFDKIKGIEDFEIDYNDLKSNTVDEGTYKIERRTNYKIDNIDYDGYMYYFDDKNIVITFALDYSYTFTREYIDFMASVEGTNETRTESQDVEMILEKTKDGYILKNGDEVIPTD